MSAAACMSSQASYREAWDVRLTPPGEAFLHHARGVLRQAEQLRRDLHDDGGGLRGHVRVFANTTAVTDFLPEVLPGFLAANPRVNVDLQEKPSAPRNHRFAKRRMVSGGVGVAIVPESAAGRNLKPLKLAQIELSDAWRVRERYVRARPGGAARLRQVADRHLVQPFPRAVARLPSAGRR